MGITLDLPEELEKDLSAEAGRLGLSLSDYVLQVFATGLRLTNGAKNGADSELQALPGGNSEFEQQKEAFKRIPPGEFEQYNNQFVAARDGAIVDHDEDLVVLTGRFFDRYGDVPVYIKKIGEPHRVILRRDQEKREMSTFPTSASWASISTITRWCPSSGTKFL
jgi:hypothetical protein